MGGHARNSHGVASGDITGERNATIRPVSFDLAVLSGAQPLSADQAREAYERLAAGEQWSAVLQPDPRVAQFVSALSARWPDLGTLPATQMDTSPWSNGFEVSPAHVLINMRWSAPDQVIGFCETTAARLGLNLFDPQDGTLYAPGKDPMSATPRPQKTLTCEVCGKLIDPGTPYAESPKVMHMTCLFSKGFP